MKLLAIIALVGVVMCNLHLNVKYRDVLYGRQPFSEEIAREIYAEFQSVYAEKSESRFEVFRKTLEEVIAHNMKKSSWVQGLNDYSDLTFEEFKKMRLMAPQNCSATKNLRVTESWKNKQIPASYDWHKHGVVTPVKNQGNCGSCWTFSTVGALEAHWNILGLGKNVTFSEQQLVDCAGDYDNHGCNGGLPSQAFEYIKNAGGIERDSTYIYTAKDGACTFKPAQTAGYVKYGSYNITQNDEDELKERLYAAGPISICYEVVADFKNYAGGVYTSNACGTTTMDVNHAVLATGYGNENGKDFWEIKNSWGATWGVNGYFKMERGVNMCAVAQCNSYPLVNRPANQGLEEVPQEQ